MGDHLCILTETKFNIPLPKFINHSGALAVALGAFGAHGLKKIVSEQSLNVSNEN